MYSHANKSIPFLSEFKFKEFNIYLQIFKSVVDCIQCQEPCNIKVMSSSCQKLIVY